MKSPMMENLIFEKPALAPLSNRVGWAFFTAFFWVMWVYLWMPLVTIILWALGFDLLNDYFIRDSKNNMGDMKHLFVLYASVVVVLGGSLLVWARTEFMRFHNVNRRTRPIPVEMGELAAFAHVAPERMAELSSVHRMIVHHDEHGKFLYADVLG